MFWHFLGRLWHCFPSSSWKCLSNPHLHVDWVKSAVVCGSECCKYCEDLLGSSTLVHASAFLFSLSFWDGWVIRPFNPLLLHRSHGLIGGLDVHVKESSPVSWVIGFLIGPSPYAFFVQRVFLVELFRFHPLGETSQASISSRLCVDFIIFSFTHGLLIRIYLYG